MCVAGPTLNILEMFLRLTAFSTLVRIMVLERR